MASHRDGRFSVIEVILIGAVAGAISCEGGAAGGGRGSPPASTEQPTVSALTTATAKTAAGEQARASAWSNRAAIYRQLSTHDKAVVAALAGDTGRAATVRTTRQAAADLADQLAAGAQKAADLHTQKAADIAAQTADGMGGGQ